MPDSTKAWEKAFSGKGSVALQTRLKKVHAKNPAFQSWLQSSGHAAGESVKKASKEVKPTERTKKLAKMSDKAYGATTGTAVGNPESHSMQFGGGDKSASAVKIYTPDEIHAINTQRGSLPREMSPEEKRMNAIRTAMERIKRKQASKFDVPTAPVEADTAEDLVQKHRSIHVSEEADQIDEVRQLDDFDKFHFSSIPPGPGLDDFQKSSMRRRGKEILEPGHKVRIALPSSSGGYWDGHKGTIISSHGDEHVVQTHRGGHTLLAHSSELKRIAEDKIDAVSEEVEQVDEGKFASTIAAIATHAYEPKVGDKVRTRKGGQIPGKVEKIKGNKVYFRHPEGKLYATHSSNLMREAVKDAADEGEYDYEGDMAKSQLRSIMHNAKRMHDMLEDNTNLPEWVQSKITLAEDYISTAANYMQGEMSEAVEPKVATVELQFDKVSIPTAAPRVDQFPATVPARKIKLPGKLKVLSPVVNAPVVQKTARRAATAARDWFTSLKQAKTTVPAKVPSKVDTKTMDPATAALTVAAGVAGLATQLKTKPEVAVQTQTQTQIPTQTEPQVATVTAPKPAEVKPETQTQVKPKPETQTQTQTATSAGLPPPPTKGKPKLGGGAGRGGLPFKFPSPSISPPLGMGKYYSGGRTSFATGTQAYEIPAYYQFEGKALPGLANLPSVRKNKLARMKVSKVSESLDPVGREDTDTDNDGKHNTASDKYIQNKRAKIGRAIQSMSTKKNGK